MKEKKEFVDIEFYAEFKKKKNNNKYKYEEERQIPNSTKGNGSSFPTFYVHI